MKSRNDLLPIFNVSAAAAKMAPTSGALNQCIVKLQVLDLRFRRIMRRRWSANALKAMCVCMLLWCFYMIVHRHQPSGHNDADGVYNKEPEVAAVREMNGRLQRAIDGAFPNRNRNNNRNDADNMLNNVVSDALAEKYAEKSGNSRDADKYFAHKRPAAPPPAGAEMQVEDPVESLRKNKAAAANDLNNNVIVGSSDSKYKTADNQNAKAIFKSGELGNYEVGPIEGRTGAGEMGKAVHLTPEEKQQSQRWQREFGFNMIASDKVAMDRNIPDTRPDECKYWHYPAHLPKTSVVIVFHNEMWTTLLRTVHSIIERTPVDLLEEVLLLDDFSDKPHLKQKLEDYIHKTWPSGVVRLERNHQREGLIRAKSIGAQLSRGEIVFFLDAHCEVGYNWLPPLVTPIAQNRAAMTVPVIDGIDSEDFSIRPQYQGSLFRGIFEWGLLYKETELPMQETKKREHYSEPYASPTHAGGLFAMNRQYFLELGGYDDGLLIWGGENFELSFKIWQCGGEILWVPCSHIGHIYRGFMPYGFGDAGKKAKGPIVTLNYKRVAEVWMDEYKEFFYAREPLARNLDAGDLSKQKALRDRLQCKSFKWFMDNVAYDVEPKYPKLPPNKHWGALQSVRQKTLCFDSMGQNPPAVVGATHCHWKGGNQLIKLNLKGQLSVGEWCIDADANGQVVLKRCAFGSVDGPWQYDEMTQQVRNTERKTCATLDKSDQGGKLLRMRPCINSAEGGGDDLGQKWIFNSHDIKISS